MLNVFLPEFKQMLISKTDVKAQDVLCLVCA